MDVRYTAVLGGCAGLDGCRFLLAGNGGQYNRGCQAIELGTMRIAARSFPGCEFISMPFSPEWDGDVPSAHETRVYPFSDADYFRGSTLFARRAAWFAAPRHRWRLYSRAFDGSDDLIAGSSAVLQVGGDNYTLDYGRPDAYVALDRRVLGSGVPDILWGASVGPFTRDKTYERFMAQHLSALTAIFVREDDSVEYLKSIGVEDNVHRVADPAFVMLPKGVDSDAVGFEIGSDMVGLNLSPLLGPKLGLSRGQWVALAGEIMTAVSHATGRPLLLVPHVIHPMAQDDERFMLDAAQHAGLRDFYSLPRTLSAPQVKGVIAELACFIGARTHATIAALSTCTPCGSLAYSMKARGINRDIYGHTDLLVDLHALSPEAVADLAERLLQEGPGLRRQLSERMPGILESAWRAGDIMEEMLRG